MLLLLAPRHFLFTFIILSCLWDSLFSQTFEFSRGWTNGKKRSLIRPTERHMGGEKLTQKRQDLDFNPEILCQLQNVNFILDKYRQIKINRLCNLWLSSQGKFDDILLTNSINQENSDVETEDKSTYDSTGKTKFQSQ